MAWRGYNRRFIKNFAQIARPLTEQLKKDSFGWNESAESAFEDLKIAITNAPVLRVPDFDKEFMVESDASGTGLGAVLSQEKHPIAFFSKILGPRAQSKSIYEKELMAIALAVQKWRHYLIGRKFLVLTDQSSLRFIMDQREVGSDYQKWVSKLMGYNFEIKYRPGKANCIADALSRKGHGQVELGALITSSRVQWDVLNSEIAADNTINLIKKGLETGEHKFPGYSLEGTRLLYKGRLVIPSTSSIIPTLLFEYHNTASSGHNGDLKTYLRLATDWYWPGMRKKIAQYVRECEICQKQKSSRQHPSGLLQPLPIPTQVWEEITMDFVEGLPKSGGFDCVLVVVDRLTKYAHFLGLKHPFTAHSVAALFIKEVVRLHGFPTSIISDRDRVFLSLFWKELFRLQGTTLLRSTSYHPQTDGQSEIVNQAMETYLRCFINGKPRTWAKWLPWAEFCYNTAPHTSIQMTPFRALYGRDPPIPTRVNRNDTTVDSLHTLLVERDAILDELKANLARAQVRMKHFADLKRKEENFEVGDRVLLKLQPYRQQSLAKRSNEKLAARFYGPYTVTEKIGAVAYRLDLPSDSKIHSVFHVSQLKKAHGTSFFTAIPPQISADLEFNMIPEALLDVKKDEDGTIKVLIKWEAMDTIDATWEIFDNINHLFPTFHLEDKVNLWPGGIIMDQATNINGPEINPSEPPTIITYQRRGKFSKGI